MRKVAVLILAILTLPAFPADISVRVSGAPTDGVLVFQVYDSASAFGEFRDPVTEQRSTIRSDGTYVIENIAPGEKALVVYLDENLNEQLDKNFIGIPKEPLGISNNYRPKGPPVYQRARFAVRDGETATVDIAIYRLLGERGQVGVGAGVIGRSSPYLDSDATVTQAIPVITYNGERLQWLGPNIQYSVLGTGQWRLAAAASYRIGAYEENDSIALAGLGDRNGTLMAGLAFRLEVPGGANFSLRYEHDVLDKIGGGAATAQLSKSFQAGRWRFSPQVQANWLSADLSNYDFGVPQTGSTVIRPAYQTGSTTSVEVGVSGFYELNQNWIFVSSLSTEFLPDSITSSPIVDDSQLIKFFAALTYVF